MIIGGSIKEIPPPHRRMFDDRRRKRTVKVTIMTWAGLLGRLAEHYYVKVKLEHDCIWNTERNTWQQCHDDEKGRGPHIRQIRCPNQEAAFRTVRRILRRFPTDRYKHEINNEGGAGSEAARAYRAYTRSGD